MRIGENCLGIGIILIFLMLPLCGMAQPKWVKNMPSAENETYFFVTAYGNGCSYREARRKADFDLFKTASQNVGVVVDLGKVSKALNEGTDVDVLQGEYNIPMRKSCEYRRNTGSGVEVYLLYQVAVSGNVNARFTDFGKCENHKSDPIDDNLDFCTRVEMAVVDASGRTISDCSEDDYIYVHHFSTKAGYITIWMEDADEEVFRILPFRGKRAMPVEANRTYLLFSKREDAKPIDGGMMFQYSISHGGSEKNQVYEIFVPFDYSNGVVSPTAGTDDIENMSGKEFKKWLERLQKEHSGTIVKTSEIVIHPKRK